MIPLATKLLKFLVFIFGAGLSVAGLWYLTIFISHIDLVPHLTSLDAAQLAGIAVLTLCLSFAYILIALSWRAILSDYGWQIPIRRAQLIFSIANIGKYAPGNVLHMAGRQLLTMREGVPGWVVAKSLVVEMSLLVLTSAIFAGGFWSFSQIGETAGIIFFFALFLILAICAWALQQFGLRGFSHALLGHSAYHLIGGLVFSLLFILISDDMFFDANLIFFLVAAYVASWVIGVLTPGAPAGLGVREALLLGFLTDVVPDVAVLGAAVLLSRGMSILSDLLYFLVLHGLSLRSIRTTFLR